jgi:hypothetical protein
MSVEAMNQLKKDLETWDYFFTNEFVYAGKPTSGKRVFKGGYIERYLRSDLCLCFTLKHGECYYIAVVEAFTGAVNSWHIAELNDGFNETWDNLPVFIDSIDFMKPPKTFSWRPLPSIVRLKAFDNRVDIDRYVNHFSSSPTSRIIEVDVAIKDGEFCTSMRIVRAKQCQLPSQVVKGRPKVVSNFSNKQPPFSGGKPVDLKNKGILGLLGIALWDDLAWFGVRFPEQLYFPVEDIELFLCPDNFELSTF